jgi:hypothetical protein
MKKNKSFSVFFLGGITSLAVLFSACPGAACFGCGGACYIPIISALGFSSAGLMASGWLTKLQPLFIAVGAILFTISYHSIFKKHKRNSGCPVELEHDCQYIKSEKKNTFVKVFYWICVVICIAVVVYPIIHKPAEMKIPFIKRHTEVIDSKYAFFDVDCLFWNEKSRSLACKGRVEPISLNVYKLHEYAVKNKILTLFTTCCSARMPQKNEMDSLGIGYVPLEL